MKKIILSLIVVFAIGLSLPGCGGVEQSKEMKDFLSMMNATSEAVDQALTKYGAEDLDRSDMDIWMLEQPNVISNKDETYTVEFKSGITIRTYEISWKDAKIVKIVDKGIK